VVKVATLVVSKPCQSAPCQGKPLAEAGDWRKSNKVAAFAAFLSSSQMLKDGFSFAMSSIPTTLRRLVVNSSFTR